MKKMSEESKAKARYAFQHPIQWLRGDSLSPESITPFEKATQLLGRGLTSFFSGFTKYRGFLYSGTGPGKVPPKYTAVTGLIGTTWDAINDPVVGTYMDTHPWKTSTHRTLMRISGIIGPIFSLLTMYNMGLSPLVRVISWSVTGILGETLGTFTNVSGAKVSAAITPFTAERRKLQYWGNIGRFLGTALQAVTPALMGLRDILGISDYQIMTWGALLTFPLALTGNLLPSFVNQRVEFSHLAPGEKPLSIRECLSVARHNTWFMRGLIIGFIQVFTPRFDSMYFYRYLVKPFALKIGNRDLKFNSEMIFTVKNSIVPIPGTLMMPFARRYIEKFGGEKNMVLINSGVKAVSMLLTYFIGYKSWWRLLLMYLLEVAVDIPHHWVSVANGTIDFQMLNYVEWKTGVRSEGVNMAVNALFEKLITNNVDSLVGNFVTQWSGFLGTSDQNGRELKAEDQPKRFIDLIWPFLTLCTVFDETVNFIIRWLWKQPENILQIEEELEERRALAKKLQEEALREEADV